MALHDSQRPNGRTLRVHRFTSDAEHNDGQEVVNLSIFESDGELSSVVNVSLQELLTELGWTWGE